jgi:hypothetical protein
VVIREVTFAKSFEKLIKLPTIKLSNPATRPTINTKETRLDKTLGNRYRSKNKLIGVKSTAKNAPKAKGIRIDFPMIRIKITTINNDKTAKALR